MSLQRAVKIAERHHHVPVVDPSNFHLGILFTAIGWILISLYTAVIEKIALTSTIDTSSSFSYLFAEFSVFHLAMLAVLLIFSASQGKHYFICKKPTLVITRGVIAYVSFISYSIAKISTDTIDNTILYSLDPFWLIVILWFVGIKVKRSLTLVMAIGAVSLIFIYHEDLIAHSPLSWFFGTSSGLTLAIITLMTSYMIKQDPPLRIGLYHSAIGLFFSLTLLCIGIISGDRYLPSLSNLLSMAFSGVLFAIALFCFLQAFYYTESYIISVTSFTLPLFTLWSSWIVNNKLFSTSSFIGTMVTSIATLFVFFLAYYDDKKNKRYGDGSKV